jgi:hypothetical protein
LSTPEFQWKEVNPDAVLEFFGQCGKKGTQCKLTSLPMALSETPIKDVTSFLAVLKYCMRSPNCKTSLQGKPLLLTADLYLRQFDETDVKYVTRHCGVAPHALASFVHVRQR